MSFAVPALETPQTHPGGLLRRPPGCAWCGQAGGEARGQQFALSATACDASRAPTGGRADRESTPQPTLASRQCTSQQWGNGPAPAMVVEQCIRQARLNDGADGPKALGGGTARSRVWGSGFRRAVPHRRGAGGNAAARRGAGRGWTGGWADGAAPSIAMRKNPREVAGTNSISRPKDTQAPGMPRPTKKRKARRLCGWCGQCLGVGSRGVRRGRFSTAAAQRLLKPCACLRAPPDRGPAAEPRAPRTNAPPR
jgi:hypothetical protein